MMYLFFAIIFQELRHELLSVFCLFLFILNSLLWLLEDHNKKR